MPNFEIGPSVEMWHAGNILGVFDSAPLSKRRKGHFTAHFATETPDALFGAGCCRSFGHKSQDPCALFPMRRWKVGSLRTIRELDWTHSWDLSVLDQGGGWVLSPLHNAPLPAANGSVTAPHFAQEPQSQLSTSTCPQRRVKALSCGSCEGGGFAERGGRWRNWWKPFGCGCRVGWCLRARKSWTLGIFGPSEVN